MKKLIFFIGIGLMAQETRDQNNIKAIETIKSITIDVLNHRVEFVLVNLECPKEEGCTVSELKQTKEKHFVLNPDTGKVVSGKVSNTIDNIPTKKLHDLFGIVIVSVNNILDWWYTLEATKPKT